LQKKVKEQTNQPTNQQHTRATVYKYRYVSSD